MAVIDLTIESFDSMINQHEMMVLEFWAPWCEPCKPQSAMIEAMASHYKEVVFAKVDIEDQSNLAKSMQVRSIPTLLFIRGKIVIFAHTGLISAAILAQYLAKLNSLDMQSVRQDFEQAHAKHKD